MCMLTPCLDTAATSTVSTTTQLCCEQQAEWQAGNSRGACMCMLSPSPGTAALPTVRRYGKQVVVKHTGQPCHNAWGAKARAHT
jgi:hypothetical protein